MSRFQLSDFRFKILKLAILSSFLEMIFVRKSVNSVIISKINNFEFFCKKILKVAIVLFWLFSIHSDIQNWWVVIFVIAIKEKTSKITFMIKITKIAIFTKKSLKVTKNWPRIDLQATRFSEITRTIDF